MSSRAQIVATIGPASEQPEVLQSMIESGMDIARLNFAWLDTENGGQRIELIRAAARTSGHIIPIIADLPGPRIQRKEGHTYDASLPFSITPNDEETLRLCAEKKVDYVALSFVGSGDDVRTLPRNDTKIRRLAKNNRKNRAQGRGLEHIDGIIAAADAVMVARGDLGNEVPLEEIPFVQKMIIAKANAGAKAGHRRDADAAVDDRALRSRRARRLPMLKKRSGTARTR